MNCVPISQERPKRKRVLDPRTLHRDVRTAGQNARPGAENRVSRSHLSHRSGPPSWRPHDKERFAFEATQALSLGRICLLARICIHLAQCFQTQQHKLSTSKELRERTKCNKAALQWPAANQRHYHWISDEGTSLTAPRPWLGQGSFGYGGHC